MKMIRELLDGFGWACEEALALAVMLLSALRIRSWYEAGQVLGVALLFTLGVLAIACGIVLLKGALS